MDAAGRDRLRLWRYLCLLALPGVGRTTLWRHMAQNGQGWAWLDEEDEAGLQRRVSGGLFPDAAALEAARSEASRQCSVLDRPGIRTLMRGQEDFPPGLERLKDPPALIFVEGGPLPAAPVALVGTRVPSAEGLAAARVCGAAFAKAGKAVVNGLAAGIDQAALSAALDAGGACVAVLASGLGIDLGPVPERLARRIVSAGGCVVSEYPPGTAAHKGSFIERDRIQAGLSDAVVVFEARLPGGTLHTARAARAAGVPVFALMDPEARRRAAADAGALAPAQRGVWELLRTSAALPADSPGDCVARVRAALAGPR